MSLARSTYEDRGIGPSARPRYASDTVRARKTTTDPMGAPVPSSDGETPTIDDARASEATTPGALSPHDMKTVPGDLLTTTDAAPRRTTTAPGIAPPSLPGLHASSASNMASADDANKDSDSASGESAADDSANNQAPAAPPPANAKVPPAGVGVYAAPRALPSRYDTPPPEALVEVAVTTEHGIVRTHSTPTRRLQQDQISTPVFPPRDGVSPDDVATSPGRGSNRSDPLDSATLYIPGRSKRPAGVWIGATAIVVLAGLTAIFIAVRAVGGSKTTPKTAEGTVTSASLGPVGTSGASSASRTSTNGPNANAVTNAAPDDDPADESTSPSISPTGAIPPAVKPNAGSEGPRPRASSATHVTSPSSPSTHTSSSTTSTRSGSSRPPRPSSSEAREPSHDTPATAPSPKPTYATPDRSL